MLTPPPNLSEQPPIVSDSPTASTGLVVRQLRLDEWPRLEALPPYPDGPLPEGFLPPDNNALVLIAERAGEIVGFWMTVLLPHSEGFWIREDQRKRSRLPVRMVEGMRQLLDDASIPHTFCWTDRPDVADYMVRLGMIKLPVESFLFPATPPSSCPSSSPPSPPELEL